MERYWQWLCSQPELYRPYIKKLLGYFQSPQNVYEAADRELEKCTFLKPSQILCLKKAKRSDNIEHDLSGLGISFISAQHPDYPDRLRQIPDYPYGLFYRGQLPSDSLSAVAVVGARRCSSYGSRMAKEAAALLAGCEVQLISGMAMGIDSIAQQAFLENGGRSFAVLGCGADICYPRSSLKLYEQLLRQGGILSEYPPGREPLARHFPIRNRIISGLSETVLVIEARERSGSLITADFALEQGRDIMAVPGRIGDRLSAGCNALIAQGAGIILSPQQLPEELDLQIKKQKIAKKTKIILETKENMVYSCVDFHPVSLDEIIGRTNLTAPEAMSLISILVLKGLIREPMKNYYMRAD